MLTNKKIFRQGVLAEIPIIIGVFPFGLIYGALAISSGLSPLQAQSMSAIIFAGSAQFITVQLIEQGTPALVLIITIAVVNLRHLLYSASLAPHLQHLPMSWKVGISYLLTDECYAPSILRYEKDITKNLSTQNLYWFVFGCGIALWLSWQVSTALGVYLGALLPQNLPLSFALPLTFIAMLVPSLKKQPMIICAISAGIVALISYNLPYKIGLILAALVGIAVGILFENINRRKK